LKPFTSGKLLDQFKEILNGHPPDPLPLEDGGCPYCSGPIGPNGRCMDLCYLPRV
jgi:hypothetical protein